MNIEHQEEQAISLYYQGEYKRAFTIFLQLATEHNHAESMSFLAVMYSSGESVAQDFEQSIYWDLKAIEGGSISSMANVGITYRMVGEIERAKYWFSQSIESGDIESALPLAKLYMVSDKESDTIRYLLALIIKNAHENPQSISQDSLKEATELFMRFS